MTDTQPRARMRTPLQSSALASLLLLSTALTGSSESLSGNWPDLPERDGSVAIPAQEWPAEPGARSVTVFIRYPGGALENVGPNSGLMLSLHNWGGTDHQGAPDPARLAERYDVVAISVDYLQSGRYNEGRYPPYDFGYLQALDALRSLYFVWQGLETSAIPFARDRIYATGGSGGGNVALMANKLAPRTFAAVFDISGMAKLNDDIAFGLEGGSALNAGYSREPSSLSYLSQDEQAIRFVGHPEHLARMRELGNTGLIVVVHGVSDAACPVEDVREMLTNFQVAGMRVEPHLIEASDVDGQLFKNTGHSLGDRTEILMAFADPYLLPSADPPLRRSGTSDFERRDETVRYETASGQFVIAYTQGYAIGRFERDSSVSR